MVGQIGPLVQVGRKKTALALHVLGGIAGGLAIGIVLGFLGVLLRAAIGDALDTVFVIVVPAALIYAALVDLGVLPVRSLTWVRQTPGDWTCSMGHYPGIFAWGFDLGLGVTTRIPYQTLLVVPARLRSSSATWARPWRSRPPTERRGRSPSSRRSRRRRTTSRRCATRSPSGC